MDEIEKRLRESADSCVKFYEAWRANEKDGKTREELLEAIHELRKVASRLEIEMAVSEREEMAGKPIPIPPHRSSQRDKNNNGNILDDKNVPGNSSSNSGPKRGRGGRRPQKKSSGNE